MDRIYDDRFAISSRVKSSDSDIAVPTLMSSLKFALSSTRLDLWESFLSRREG